MMSPTPYTCVCSSIHTTISLSSLVLFLVSLFSFHTTVVVPNTRLPPAPRIASAALRTATSLLRSSLIRSASTAFRASTAFGTSASGSIPNPSVVLLATSAVDSSSTRRSVTSHPHGRTKPWSHSTKYPPSTGIRSLASASSALSTFENSICSGLSGLSALVVPYVSSTYRRMSPDGPRTHTPRPGTWYSALLVQFSRRVRSSARVPLSAVDSSTSKS